MTNISITSLNFLRRFTPAEVVAIDLSTDPDVVYVRALGKAAQFTVSDDPLLLQGMAVLVAKGLLTEQRKVQILDFANPSPP